ncbi:hypothetical protein B296_00041280 [Ensete ventricosum]|uniref:Uncharacterized protein n=1 Tax=Ensete ventricosum TaxID=4639 RepID=A0A426YX08_ENSVE|nr:hypothetical protein B296_00041280 [Ensete ventricosum]
MTERGPRATRSCENTEDCAAVAINQEQALKNWGGTLLLLRFLRPSEKDFSERVDLFCSSHSLLRLVAIVLMSAGSL